MNNFFFSFYFLIKKINFFRIIQCLNSTNEKEINTTLYTIKKISKFDFFINFSSNILNIFTNLIFNLNTSIKQKTIILKIIKKMKQNDETINISIENCKKLLNIYKNSQITDLLIETLTILSKSSNNGFFYFI